MEGCALKVRRSDGRRLTRAAERTGLKETSPDTFAMAFLSAASARHEKNHEEEDDEETSFGRRTTMSVSALRDVFASATGSGRDAEEEEEWWWRGLREVKGEWGRGEDRPRGREGNVIDVCVGWTLCCDGTKSQKLAVAFDLCSAGTGRLTRTGLWSFLRSFLTSICRVVDRRAVVDRRVVDRTCARAVGLVFRDKNRGLRDDDAYVTFDAFASWYNREGHMSVQWIELLDRSKWPQHHDDDDDAAIEVDLLPTLEDDDIERGTSGVLYISSGAVVRVRALVRALTTTCPSMTPQRLHRLFADHVDEDGHVEERYVRRALDTSILGASSTTIAPSSRRRLERVVSTCRVDETTRYDVVRLVLSLTALSAHKKSRKLIDAFKFMMWNAGDVAYDALARVDDDSLLCVDAGDLRTILASFLRTILALGRDDEDNDDADASLADRVVSMVSRTIATSGEVVSFRRFSEWYNDGGNEIATWLELIDVSKWTTRRTRSWPEMPEDGANDDEDDETWHAPLAALFTFAPPDRFQTLRTALSASSFDALSPEDVLDAFCPVDATIDASFVLGKSEYDEYVQALVPRDPRNERACTLLSRVFSELFYLFDWDHSGLVRRSDIAIGLSALTNGKKSRKLSAAFDTMVAAGRRREGRRDKTTLTRVELSRYFRCFLTVLAAFSGGDADDADEETRTRRLIATLCDDLALAIQRDADPRPRGDDEDDDAIAFEDFGQWYSRGGFDRAPWIELLNAEKWKGAFAHASSVG